MKIENKTILITGGSSGIGLEFAKQLLELGNKIIITSRNIDKLTKVKQHFPQIHIWQCDITQIEEIKLLFKNIIMQFPDLSILINNAGIGQTLVLKKHHDPAMINTEIKTNLMAPINMINEFLPHLLKQNDAAIINITSATAFSPFPILPVYCASKAGLHSYTLSLRAQLHKTDVKVFEIAPPTTQTDMLRGFSSKEIKNIPVMPVQQLVKVSLRSIYSDEFEICPGQSKKLRLLSRLAPNFILKQMSKNLNKMENI